MRISAILLFLANIPFCGGAAAADAESAPLGGPLQVLQPEFRLGSFTHLAQILPARQIARAGSVQQLRYARRPLDDVRFQHDGRERTVGDYLAERQVMALLVLKDGRIAYEQYRQGTSERTQFTSWSMAKSIVSTLLGVAQSEARIGSLRDPLTRYAPELAESAYGANAIEDLLQMTSGVRFIEDYGGNAELESRAWVEGTVTRKVRYQDTFVWFKERLHPPGTRFYYASLEPAVLG